MWDTCPDTTDTIPKATLAVAFFFAEEAMPTPKQTITLDVNRRDASPPRVYLGSGDHNGTTLKVILTEDGRPHDTELTPYLMIGWGTGSYRQEGSVSGNVATIPIDEANLGDFYGVTGNAYISLEGEDVITSTQRFVVHVAKSAAEETEEGPAGEFAEPTIDEEGD